VTIKTAAQAARWKGEHTRVAQEHQGAVAHVQHRVMEEAWPGSPDVAAVVEEHFPMEAVSDPHAYFGSGGDPDELERRMSRMVTSIERLGADDSLDRLDVVPTSRYRWVFPSAEELVAHGRNTGENFATRFSNEMDSRQTSLGLFVTDDPYVGSNGYSLRLDGLDVGFNDRARDRAIVMHGAPYVDPQLAATQGRIGRSWGCPALRSVIAAKVIDRIRGGSVVFSYYPDQDWLQHSRFLTCGATS
jgi:hypothetical protein